MHYLTHRDLTNYNLAEAQNLGSWDSIRPDLFGLILMAEETCSPPDAPPKHHLYSVTNEYTLERGRTSGIRST